MTHLVWVVLGFVLLLALLGAQEGFPADGRRLRQGPFPRTVTTLRGNVRHGDSGGPAVDAAGAVETTVFASRIGGGSGFGVPTSAVRNALQNAKGPVSTGPCAS